MGVRRGKPVLLFSFFKGNYITRMYLRFADGKFKSGKFQWSLTRKVCAGFVLAEVLLMGSWSVGEKYPAYTTLIASNVSAAELPVNLMPNEMRAPFIYEKQMALVRKLSDVCEFRNKSQFPLIIDPKESGGYQVSMADFQWEANSLREDYRKLYGELLNWDEVIILALDEERVAEVTRRSIFELGNLWRWHNCARTNGLYQEVEEIKKLEK